MEAMPGPITPPSKFGDHVDLFPTTGFALELACGSGGTSVWLALRGLKVHGVDISGTAIGLAKKLAAENAVSSSCRFDVVDLDRGLPEGPQADLVVCHLFRDVRLYPQMVQRLTPGGLLAVAVLSEVDAKPGPFRAMAGELTDAFGHLEILEAGEGDGHAWILARGIETA